MPGEHSIEHQTIRLAWNCCGPTTSGCFEERAYGAAIGQNDRLIGRTNPVRMRRNIWQSTADPISSLRETIVGQCGIESDNDHFWIPLHDFKTSQPKIFF